MLIAPMLEEAPMPDGSERLADPSRYVTTEMSTGRSTLVKRLTNNISMAVQLTVPDLACAGRCRLLVYRC